MSSSTIPAAKAAVFTLLTGATYPVPVTTVWGTGGPVPTDYNRVYLADVLNIARTWVTFPRNLSETYDLQLIVEHFEDGADMQGAETALWGIVAAIETAVRADGTAPYMGVLLKPVLPSIDSQQTGAFEQGVLSRVVMHLSCEARI